MCARHLSLVVTLVVAPEKKRLAANGFQNNNGFDGFDDGSV